MEENRPGPCPPAACLELALPFDFLWPSLGSLDSVIPLECNPTYTVACRQPGSHSHQKQGTGSKCWQLLGLDHSLASVLNIIRLGNLGSTPVASVEAKTAYL